MKRYWNVTCLWYKFMLHFELTLSPPGDEDWYDRHWTLTFGLLGLVLTFSTWEDDV